VFIEDMGVEMGVLALEAGLRNKRARALFGEEAWTRLGRILNPSIR